MKVLDPSLFPRSLIFISASFISEVKGVRVREREHALIIQFMGTVFFFALKACKFRGREEEKKITHG